MKRLLKRFWEKVGIPPREFFMLCGVFAAIVFFGGLGILAYLNWVAAVLQPLLR